MGATLMPLGAGTDTAGGLLAGLGGLFNGTGGLKGFGAVSTFNGAILAVGFLACETGGAGRWTIGVSWDLTGAGAVRAGLIAA